MRHVAGPPVAAVLSGLAVALMLLPTHAQAQQRRAFLVATGAYEHLRKSPLETDAFRTIAKALRGNGFEVAEAFGDRSSVIRAKFARFVRRVRADDLVLFILAGHMLSADRGALYLPREAEVRNASDVFRRAITLRMFADAASRGRSGLVLMLSTNPEVATQSNELSPYPNNIAPPPGNVVLAFSSSRDVPVARIDYAAGKALERLVQVVSRAFDDGRRLAEAVAGRDAGTIIGRPIRMPIAAAPVPSRPAGLATGDTPPRAAIAVVEADNTGAAANRMARYREDIEQQARLISELRKEMAAERRARAAAEERATGAGEKAGVEARAAEQRAADALKAKLEMQAEAERQKTELSKRLAALTERLAEAERQQKAAEASRPAALAKARELARQADERARTAERMLRAERTQATKLSEEIARLEKAAATTELGAERRLARAQELEEKLALIKADRASETSAYQAAQERAASAAAKLRRAEGQLAKFKEAKAAIEAELRDQIAAGQKRAREEQKVRGTLEDRLRRTEEERDRLKEMAARVVGLEANLKHQEQARKSAETVADEAAEKVRQAVRRAEEAEAFAQTAAERLRAALAHEAEARKIAQQSADSAAKRTSDAERRAREAEEFAQIAAESARAARSQAVIQESRLREEIESLRKQLALLEQQQTDARQSAP